MNIKTKQPHVRFAPSPTGLLHLGGARTALFNFLFARHYQGMYSVRIEDTDVERSKPEYTQNIIDGLQWLGISPDSPPLFQSKYICDHQETAHNLLDKGYAYWCYETSENLAQYGNNFDAKKEAIRKWRDYTGSPPIHIQPTLRLKIPVEGNTKIHDLIQGTLSVKNKELEDFTILRANGSPTYMLSVVCDDIAQKITHVIRGTDHITNTFKQSILYYMLQVEEPKWAHIPLIHNTQGKKLSKRDGATDILYYKQAGYLPEALLNYLLLLGFSYENQEIFSLKEMIEVFDLSHMHKAPARFDVKKLQFINNYYIKNENAHTLCSILQGIFGLDIPESFVCKAIALYQNRVKTLVELKELIEQLYTFHIPTLQIGDKQLLWKFLSQLHTVSYWDTHTLNTFCHEFIEKEGISFKILGIPLRQSLTGKPKGPNNVDIMIMLGKKETIKRIELTIDSSTNE